MKIKGSKKGEKGAHFLKIDYILHISHRKKSSHLCNFNSYNVDSACQFSNVVAVIAFLASIGELELKVLVLINFGCLFLGFLVGEFFFDQMSSVKSRKHFVIADLSFSSNIFTKSKSLSWLVYTGIVCRFLDLGLHDILPYDDLSVEY